MTTLHYASAAVVLLFITVLGVVSGKKVTSASAFSGGERKAGASLVAGSIIGSLVGGASTIGTAQLAYSYGFSAWWFTLGGGIGCLVLGLFFVSPLYGSGVRTLPHVFAREYGQRASTASALLTSLGNFLTIASQVLSGVALITSVSGIEPFAAGLVTVVMMLAYVVFGGVWGAGMVGLAKSVLVYAGVGGCGILAIHLQGGVGSFLASLPAERYFNIVARGGMIDIGAGLSLIFGVLTTQAYIQAVLSARTAKTALRGVFACSLLVPVIGVAGIFIGMYMRLNYPNIVPAAALPLFVVEKTPPALAGAILAILLVTLVGTGAGISLGLTQMLVDDLYRVYFDKRAGDARILFVSRLLIAVILVGALWVVLGNMGTMILNLSYMSMGLRGAVAFPPLCAALFLPGQVPTRCALAAMIAGPALVLVGGFVLPPSVDPLFLGIACSTFLLLIGIAVRRKTSRGDSNERVRLRE